LIAVFVKDAAMLSPKGARNHSGLRPKGVL
jgi:hypothetical protein